MIDAVVGQGAFQWLGDVLLADHLGECVRAVAPVQSKRRRTCSGDDRLVEQRLLLSAVERFENRLHACTLCPSPDRMTAARHRAPRMIQWTYGSASPVGPTLRGAGASIPEASGSTTSWPMWPNG